MVGGSPDGEGERRMLKKVGDDAPEWAEAWAE